MHWYEEDIIRLEAEIAVGQKTPGIAFYGSSSIRLWESLEDDFREYQPLNLGFGGSTLAACGWFFERVFATLDPRCIIIYAGDNDLGDGRSPEEVFLFFNELLHVIHQRYGDLPIGFISIKPSITRWEIMDKIRHANRMIEAAISKSAGNVCFINIYDSMTDKKGFPKHDFLEPDGLHINEKGYQLWKDIILGTFASGSLKLR